jgi:hypothetical protein
MAAVRRGSPKSGEAGGALGRGMGGGGLGGPLGFDFGTWFGRWWPAVGCPAAVAGGRRGAPVSGEVRARAMA